MATTASPSAWLSWPQRRPQANVRLFCFPYAGSGASVFARWPDELPASIELCSIQLPGREGRFREPLYANLAALLPVLKREIEPFMDRPAIFFGHSLGAVLAYETAQLFSKTGKNLAYLFASGRRAPHIPDLHSHLHALPQAELIAQLGHRYNGIPAEILAEPELLDLFLPVLRADLQLLETHNWPQHPPLNCPLTVFGGVNDRSVQHADLNAWQSETIGPFRMQLFPGDHFYLRTLRSTLIQTMLQDLRSQNLI